MTDRDLRLVDFGERRLIAEVLAPRYAHAPRFGDDCASLPLDIAAGTTLVASTDPCPPPMAHQLGFEDLFYAGWLVATINLSDIAAAGAKPLGLLTSLVLPAETRLSDFERLLDGIDECCAQSATQVLGGNIKEAPRLDLAATALGVCEGPPPLSRRGATVGDAVVALGDFGAFWAGVLGVREGHIRHDDTDHTLLRNVLMPTPKVAIGREARERGVLACAMDNSDGLQPTLVQLADANDVGLLLRHDHLCFEPIVTEMAERLGTDPLRLALGFGDWQLVGCCRPERLSELRELGDELRVGVHVLGDVVPGEGAMLDAYGSRGALLALDSQRFTRGSWFSSGLEGYIRTLREAPLLQ